MKEKYAYEKDYTDQPKDNVSYVTRIGTHILLAWNRRLGPLGIIAIGLLLGAVNTQADVVAISSIKDIINGTTIDFEQPGSNANDILPIFDMTATPNASITAIDPFYTGNSDAPFSGRLLFRTYLDP